jgi:hypothetical protein
MNYPIPPSILTDCSFSSGSFSNDIKITGNLSVSGSSTVEIITGELGVFHNAIITGTTNSTSIDTGALLLAGGLGIARDVNMGGSITMSGHLITIQTVPLDMTVNIGSGFLTNATDIAGIITLTVPANTSPRTLCFVNFTNSYIIPPVVLLTPRSQRTGINDLAVSVESATGGFQINSGLESSGSEVVYVWNYFVIESINTSDPI